MKQLLLNLHFLQIGVYINDSLICRRGAHEATLCKKKKDLQQWERRLQEKLSERLRITTEREVKVDESEKALNLKDQELKRMEKEIIVNTSVLKRKEDDINHRLANLTAQEHVSSIRLNFAIIVCQI